MKHVIFCLVFLFTSSAFSQQIDPVKLDFNSAIQAFQNKDPESAKLIFREQLKLERNHIPSLFNLAVIAAQQDKRGEAAAYMRHLKTLNAKVNGIDPLSEYISDKLNITLVPTEPGYLGFLEKHIIREYSLQLWLALTWIALTCLAWVLLKFMKLKKKSLDEELSAPSLPLAFWALSLFLITSLIFTSWKGFDEMTVRGTVLSGQQNVYAGPSANEVQIFQISETEEVTYLQTQNNWHQIKTRDGKSGWIQPQSPIHFY